MDCFVEKTTCHICNKNINCIQEIFHMTKITKDNLSSYVYFCNISCWVKFTKQNTNQNN